ncbi:MAG TPA: hypothetical protein VFH73_03505, partial [Polyangia bacterium]|nr:hypothetical protein [Polyangia bacterium]
MSLVAVPVWCWLALNQPVAAAAQAPPPPPPAPTLAPAPSYKGAPPPPATGSPSPDDRNHLPGWNAVPQFRLGFSFMRVIREDGDFTVPGIQTSAAGLDFGFTSGYTRTHLGLAHQWESAGNTTARGFR